VISKLLWGGGSPEPPAIPRFNVAVFVREMWAHAFYPFSILPILLLEGQAGLRKREFILGLPAAARGSCIPWITRSIPFVWGFITWANVLLGALDYTDGNDRSILVDIAFAATSAWIHHAAVARKWATWDEKTTRNAVTSFEGKRGQEMISGWLHWAPNVRDANIVKAILTTRLERLDDIVVFHDKRSHDDDSLG
jgi:hypothetical protein